MFTIKHEYGHYVVYEDDVFYCSADTYGEAEQDIAEAIREEEKCQEKFN